MKAQIKQIWVNALRSGKYKQGKGRLRKIDDEGQYRYCCLGVLCDLYKEEHPQAQWINSIFIGNIKYESNQSNDVYLPESVVYWAGLEKPNPAAGDDSLSNYNDGSFGYEQKSFEEIADLIEEHL